MVSEAAQARSKIANCHTSNKMLHKRQRTEITCAGLPSGERNFLEVVDSR